jgi:hypothetical protein
MSDLVQESIEEVRVITETRHANSEALRARATALCAQSTALCAQSAALCAHSVQIREQSIQKGPTPEEIRAAEQPLLNRLKDSLRAAVRGPRAHDPSTERAS